MKRVIRTRSIAIVVFLFCSIVAFGQSASLLRGIISDKSGAVVVGASVELSNPQTGYSRTVTSGKDGVYQFLDLQPGTYTATVTSPGYETSKLNKLEILVNTPATANVVLQIGQQVNTVNVSASAETLNTENATAGSPIEEVQVMQLPIDSRNVNDLLSLQPGVSYLGDRPDINLHTDTRSGSVNGARSDQNTVTLDGVDATDQVNGYAFTSVLRTTPDSLEEFRVTTSNPTAAEGSSSGAQVALLTKAGTNHFHGSFYEYTRNTATSANDWFIKESQAASGEPDKAPQLNRNVFGVSVGGPVMKNRAFFFTNYEGRRDSIANSTVTEVPTASLRAGNVMYTNTSGGTSTATASQFASWDPEGIGPNVPLQAYFNSFPLPNDLSVGDGLNLSGYRFAASSPARLDVYIARVDYKLDRAGNHTIFWRGSTQNDYTTTIAPYLPGTKAQQTTEDRSKGFALGYTAILGPSLVNDLRVGYTRASIDDAGDSSQPFLGMNGITGGITRSTSYIVPVWDYVDNFSLTKGRHTLMFGGSVEFIRDTVNTNANSFSQAILGTTYIDTGGFAGTASPFNPGNQGAPAVNPNFYQAYDQAAFDVLGIISDVNASYNYDLQGNVQAQGAPVVRTYSTQQYDFYAQDSIRVRPNLTVNVGLRYQLEAPPTEVNGFQVSPTVNLGDWKNLRIANMAKGIPSSQDPTISYVLGGSKNHGAPFYNWDYKDLAPRFSIAYTPQPKTSIRAGFGMAYDHFGTEIVNTFGQTGSFGLSTELSTPLGSQSVTCAPRVTSLTAIPTTGCPGTTFLLPPPAGGFPQTPPVGFAAGGFSEGFSSDQNLKVPYTYMLNLSVERELTPTTSIELSYIGHLAHRLTAVEDFAQPMNLRDPDSGVDYYTAMSRLVTLQRQGVPLASITPSLVGPTAAYWNNLEAPIAAVGVGGTACTPGACTALQAIYSLELLYPGNETFIPYFLDIPGFICANSCNTTGPYTFYDPQFFSLNAWTNVGTSNYNALQVVFRKTLSHGLSFDVNYTYSKSMDLSSAASRVGNIGASKIINTFSPRQMYAVSDFDMTHQLNVNWIAQLPVGHGQHWLGDAPGWVNAIVAGWQLSGLYRLTSGLPFSVSNGSNLPTNGANGGYATKIAPVAAGKATKENGHVYMFKNPTAAFDAFSFTYPGQSGTRNGVRGDGYLDLDSALSKRWTMPYKNSNSIQFRWEVFNVGNFTRFNVFSQEPSMTSSTNFGNYTGLLTNPRVMQFALRYEF